MPLGPLTTGQRQEESLVTYDNITTFNRGLKAGTGFGTPTLAAGPVGVAGTGATITGQRGIDFAGVFTFNAGTGPTTAGTLATFAFASPLAVVPTSVITTVADNAGSGPLTAGASNLATTGFSIQTAQPTALHAYTVTYIVVQ